MLDDQLSASRALGYVLSERSYRGDVLRFKQWRGDRPIDKALIEEYPKYLSRQEYSPSYITLILASLRLYVNRIRDSLLDDASHPGENRLRLVAVGMPLTFLAMLILERNCGWG
jgi:hypothetical protein